MKVSRGSGLCLAWRLAAGMKFLNNVWLAQAVIRSTLDL